MKLIDKVARELQQNYYALKDIVIKGTKSDLYLPAISSTLEYPQQHLEQWQLEDTESLRKCFEGCYGAFIDSELSQPPNSCTTRAEIALGERCIRAAEV